MSTKETNQITLIVFVNENNYFWLKILRKNYRHCFVAFQSNSHWIACDPLVNKISVEILNIPYNFDLANHYKKEGHIVYKTRAKFEITTGIMAFQFLTCVSITKKIIGLRLPWILTPWQLGKYLANESKKDKNVWEIV